MREIEYAEDANGCHICTSHKKDRGYPMITAKVAVGRRRISVARFVYLKKHGSIPAGLVVRHTCDNAACINIDHLIEGTHTQNVEDRVRRKRSAVGESHGRSKLTAENVRQIRLAKDSLSSVAKKYGVSRKAIQKIKSGITWKSVT